MSGPRTVAQALAGAAALGIDRLDAQLLLLHALGRSMQDRAWLFAHDTDSMPSAAQGEYEALCRRRRDDEPLAYLVGRKEFHGLELAVDRRVLVPRPDTETLVDWALELLPRFEVTSPRVVDLGTGSGAIALAIKHRHRQADVEAVDASADALDLARANAGSLKLDMTFRQASWLADSHGPYHLIVSNPPYVAAADPHLAALRHEPISALAAGHDGLDDIRTIVDQAGPLLVPGGWLLIEHGHDQSAAVAELLSRAGFVAIAHRHDLAGIARCTGGKRDELG